ncbi:adenosine deaminase [Kushneria phosphatilytica]|uniref:Adenine deaminase n=1 Tax=Kushneria phosphatilytica TaxID=657387 RepID=A0A1S1NYW9_9GAMM|nr:adenosine deaminase [Kushneria phosphatilytica]OHV10585.1 adenosine deaminase [Kushneria phosphatilytica]QEL11837.1 adenosine deaminase [Kushneria phosphatilytica]
MKTWLKALPKAELHLHIEGTLEPELMFELAARNGVTLPYASIDEVRAAYEFSNLQSFLDLYYQGMAVLHTEQDFFELAMAYFDRAHADGVVHVELSFDPQPHLLRGLEPSVPFEGLERAMREAEQRYDISSALIMSFVRDRSAEEAMTVLEQTRAWHHRLAAIGLDSAELGNPPEKFAAVFERARELGIPRLAHAGEEGPATYISGAMDALGVCRIDHGVRCLEDPALVERLKSEQMPLTVCPLSNVYLKVVERLENHPLPGLLEQGLKVTLNSDDPAYFGGGMLNNFIACHDAFGWDQATFRQLARNALEEAFMNDERRSRLLSAVANC